MSGKNDKHVLVLAEYGVRNGAENSWLSIAELMINLGWRFTIATQAPSEFATAASKIGNVCTFDFKDGDGNRKSQTDLRNEIYLCYIMLSVDFTTREKSRGNHSSLLIFQWIFQCISISLNALHARMCPKFAL